MSYQVEVVEKKTGAIVKTIACGSARAADRVSDGVDCNLNHEQYFSRVVPTPALYKICTAPRGGCGFGPRRRVLTLETQTHCQCGSEYRLAKDQS